ncbi:MAG: hypothetical protein K8S24_03640 [Candidatus Aegiribacteria sp.]|nr:hypothetical protein [Candidatus Aegiribacteria sp.]
MRAILLGLIAASVSLGFGWTLIGDVPDNGIPIGLYEGNDDWFVIQYEMLRADTFWFSEVEVHIEGSIAGAGSDPFLSSSVPRNLYVPVLVSDENYMNMTLPQGVIRLTTSGDTLWTALLDTVSGYKETFSEIIPSSEGGCYVVFGPEQGGDTWKLYRLGDSGEVLMAWEFHLRGGPVLMLNDMRETADGKILITGVTDDLGMNLYMYLAGFDRDGNHFAAVMDDFRFHAGGEIIEQDEEANIYVAGYTGSERDDGYFMPPIDTDVFILKLNSEGEEIWRSVFEYPLENRPLLMTITDEDRILLLIKSFEEGCGGSSNYTLLLYKAE